jgi:4-hydroxy-3-polyprenylbenzoate decarboxylase
MTKNQPRRLVVGISGASGAALGVRLLEACAELEIETHLVVSRAAVLTLVHETGMDLARVNSLAAISYRSGDVGAAIASGSFATEGMIVAPCSVRSMSEIATGVTASLLTRAADVTLKERRRLVLMVRESPLHLGHLRTMTALSEMGAVIAPPVPAFYAKPADVGQIVDQCVGRALDLFGLAWRGAHRWGQDLPAIEESAE